MLDFFIIVGAVIFVICVIAARIRGSSKGCCGCQKDCGSCRVVPGKNTDTFSKRKHGNPRKS